MKNKQRLNELARFQAIAGVRSRNYLNEDDYSVPSNAISGDTAVDNIDEAGNIKGIKIEIPGNSYAFDFGKAAAREVVASFGPNGAREFLEAFVDEIRKIATTRIAARTKTPTAAPVAPTPGMQAEGEGSRGYYIFDLDGVLVKLTDIASQNEFKQKVQQKAAQDPAFKKAFLASKKEDSSFAKDATKYVDDQESVYDYTFDEWAELTIDSHAD